MYFEKLFQESQADVIEYENKHFYRYFPVLIKQSALLKFKFVSSNSPLLQAIVISFPKNFCGHIYISNQEIPVKKTAFPMLNFWEDTAPREFELSVSHFFGEVKICNGSDPLGTKQICKHMSGGCAMMVEQLSENRFRFLCNDHEYDDDCDDLVFELEIENTGNGVEIKRTGDGSLS